MKSIPIDKLVHVFKALSDETRLRIVKLLEQGELCVCDIVAALDMAQPKVSFHLGVLKESGFILDRKQGRCIRYRINDSDVFKRLLILTVMERIPDEAMRGDKKRLGEFMKQKAAQTAAVGLRVNVPCCKRG